MYCIYVIYLPPLSKVHHQQAPLGHAGERGLVAHSIVRSAISYSIQNNKLFV